MLQVLSGLYRQREQLEANSGASSTQDSTQETAGTRRSTRSKAKSTQKGTQNRGLIQRLAELKTLQNSIQWGTQYLDCKSDGQVLQIGFRDQVLVLFFTTVHRCTQEHGLEMVIRTRKRPANRNSVAKESFSTSVTNVLLFLISLNNYNHFIDAVDLGN